MCVIDLKHKYSSCSNGEEEQLFQTTPILEYLTPE